VKVATMFVIGNYYSCNCH